MSWLLNIEQTRRRWRPSTASIACRKICESRVRAKREKHNVTLQAVIEAAATESLPKIVSTLKTMGLGFDGKKRPARLPMTDSLLGAFKVASKQTGVPASRLLQAALTLTCKGAK